MSDTFAQKIAMLQDAERQKQLKSQERQAEDKAKLLPIKEEHERALRVIAQNLNIFARQVPGFLKVHWGRNALGGGYYQHGPFLIYHQASTDHRLQFTDSLEIDTAPELKDLKGFMPSTYQVPPDTKVEVIGMAQASAHFLNRSARKTSWGTTAPLGELVLDPLAELTDEDFARTRLYQSQVEALDKVKELLDEDRLARVVFDLIPDYLR